METGNKIKIGDQVKYNGYEYFVEGMLDDKTYILSNPKKFGHTKEYRTIDEIEIMTNNYSTRLGKILRKQREEMSLYDNIESWLKDGTKVKWHDPEEEARDLDRVWIITDKKGKIGEFLEEEKDEENFKGYLDDYIIDIVSEDGYSEAEVPHYEIEPIGLSMKDS